MVPDSPGTLTLEAVHRHCIQLAREINSRPDNVFKGTLRANQTTSSFSHPGIGIGSVVLAMPTTANALTAFQGLRQSTTVNGKVTFAHSSSSATDQTFLFAILGAQKPIEVTAT